MGVLDEDKEVNIVTETVETRSLADLAAPTAGEMRLSYREGSTTPAAELSRIRELIETVEPELHAWAALDWDLVSAQVAALENLDPEEASLWGVPVGVKDNIDVAGLPTRGGSKASGGAPAAKDAPVIAALRGAGAIIVGKLTTTEFATLGNPPATRNPWDTSRTPGGSSAGPAAATAAGMVSVALGTQTRGSVIRPASFTGVFGISPTPGLVPTNGVIPNALSIDRVGFFARCAQDLETVVSAASGVGLGLPGASAPRRFGIVTDERLLAGIDDDARSTLASFTAALDASGAQYVEVELPFDPVLLDHVHSTIEMTEFAQAHAAAYALQAENLGNFVRHLVEQGREVSLEDYILAQREREHLRGRLLQTFFVNGVDYLVTPASTGVAPLGIESTGSPRMSTPFTLLGLPAACVPWYATHGGALPLGIQLVGQPGSDRDLLAAAMSAAELG